MTVRAARLRKAAASAGLFVVTLSFLPNGKRMLHTRGQFHAMGHFVAFGVLSALATLSVSTSAGRGTALTLSIALAVMVESIEHLIYTTPLEYSDVLLDVFGALAGALVALVIQQLVFRRKQAVR